MENDQGSGHYDAVIADLRRRIKQFESTITLLEQLKAGGLPDGAATTQQGASDGKGPTHGPAPTTGPGAFFGMTVVDAAKKLLANQRRQMQTTEIVREIERGGIVLTSADKVNTVGSILLRRFQNSGDIVRVARGVWGLQEWYPGRKFPKTGAPKVEDSGPKEDGTVVEVGNEVETNPDMQAQSEIEDLIGAGDLA